MKKVLVLYGSSRKKGNTEYLTDYTLAHTDSLDVTKIYLRDYSISTLVDERHTGYPFPLVRDDYKPIVQEMVKADLIIFATPVYWYNMSTRTKLFVDRLTESLRDPEMNLKEDLKGKELCVICTGANPNEAVVEPMINIFRLIAKYFDMNFIGYLWANADRPGDVQNDQAALKRAEQFFE